MCLVIIIPKINEIMCLLISALNNPLHVHNNPMYSIVKSFVIVRSIDI